MLSTGKKKKEEEDTAANSLSYMFMCLALTFMFYR